MRVKLHGSPAHKPQPFHLGHDLSVRHGRHSGVGGSPKVAEQQDFALRDPPGEEAAGINGAEGGDALSPGVQLPETCRTMWRAPEWMLVPRSVASPDQHPTRRTPLLRIPARWPSEPKRSGRMAVSG